MDSIAGDMSGSRIGPNGVIQASDNQSFAWFTREPKLMVAQSESAGRDVYEERDYLHVQQNGDMHAVTREYRKGDEQRYPNAWSAYQAGRKPTHEGTPIAIMFPGQPSAPKNLESVGIHTIEQLAETPDSSLGNLPFGMDLKLRAKKYLGAVKGSESFNKLEAQLDREREKTQSLEMQMQEMRQQMATLAAQRASDPGNNVSVSPLAFTPEQLNEMIAAQIAAALPEKRGPGRPKKED
jgi:hypothetical protein